MKIFDIVYKHVGHGSLAQLGEHLPYKQRVTGSSPVTPTNLCGSGSVVERCLAKANVASSNLVFRSKYSVTAQGRNAYYMIVRHHSQVVRQRPAKPLPPVQVRVVPPISPLPLSARIVWAFLFARVAEQADARDLKSRDGNIVPVRVRFRAPTKKALSRAPFLM